MSIEKLNKIKEQYAAEHNYENWTYYIVDQPNFKVEKIMDEIALRLLHSSLQFKELYKTNFRKWIKDNFEQYGNIYISKEDRKPYKENQLESKYKTQLLLNL